MKITFAAIVYKQTIRALQDYDTVKKRHERAEDNLNRLMHTPPWLRLQEGALDAAVKEVSESRTALENLGV